MIQHLPCLKQLSLDRNLISKSTPMLLGLRNLAHIDLSLNKLQEVPLIPEACRILNIGFNRIDRFAVYLPVILEIRLPGNELIEMSTDSLIPICQVLDLSLNRLVSIPPILPMSLKLQELNLSFNFLSEAPQELPPTLRKIDMSHNELKEWKGSLMHLTKLEYFDVSYNQLQELPELPDSVTFLGCDHNRLTKSGEIKLQGLSTLWYSLGAFLVFAIVLVFCTNNSRQNRFYLPSIGVFIVSNFIRYQPGAMDNTKVFFAGWYCLACAAVANYIMIMMKCKKSVKLIVGYAICGSMFGGCVCIYKAAMKLFPLYNRNEMKLGVWMMENTKRDAAVLCSGWHANTLMALSGKLVTMGYGGWVWTHGLSIGDRQKLITNLVTNRENVDLFTPYKIRGVQIRR